MTRSNAVQSDRKTLLAATRNRAFPFVLASGLALLTFMADCSSSNDGGSNNGGSGGQAGGGASEGQAGSGGSAQVSNSTGGAGGATITGGTTGTGGVAGAGGPPTAGAGGTALGGTAGGGGTGGKANLGGAGGATNGGAGGTATAGVCSATFCDDFEAAATLNAQSWTQETNKATIELQGTRTWNNSKRAVHFHINAGGGSAFIVHKASFPALAAHLFGRARLYIDPDVNYGHTGIFVGRGSKSDFEIGNYEGGWQLTTSAGLTATGKIPAKSWACIEWELVQAPGKITVWVDGKANASYSPPGADLTGGFTAFAFGFNEYHSPTYAIDVFMDDVALGDKRIGCP